MELPKFRYVEDVLKFLASMSSEIREQQQVLTQQCRLLAGLIKPQNRLRDAKSVTAALDDSQQVQTQPIDPKASAIIIPALTKLQAQYATLKDLHEKWQLIEAVEAQVEFQFSPSSQVEKVKYEIGFLKRAIQQQMNTAFEFLGKVAKAHVPARFEQFVAAVALETSQHIVHSKNETFMYVAMTNRGSIAFTNYLVLQNAVNCRGEVAHSLYVTTQWVLGSPTEPASIKVYLTHDFEMPQSLAESGGGVSVGNAQQAVKAIANLLEIENFSSSMGIVPLALQLKVTPDMLNASVDWKAKIGERRVGKSALGFVLTCGKDESRVVAGAILMQLQDCLQLEKWRIKASLRKNSDGRPQVNFLFKDLPKFDNYQKAQLLDRFGITASTLNAML